MDLNLKGKTVIVTGGGTGIGQAAALEFLREGAAVAVFGRREKPLQQTAILAEQEGYSLYYECCDVTDRKAVSSFTERVFQKYGHIDIWVNNAGISIDKKYLDFTDEDWEKLEEIDLHAVFSCIQIAASYMKRQNGGVIINASSFAAIIPHANGAIYAAMKSGVSSLTRSTAAALAPFGIRVVGYIPGMIVTPISESMISKYKDDFTRNIAQARLGHPEDLAKPIVFLASDCASYITGTDIEISGGKFAAQDCDMAWRLERGNSK